MERIRARNIPAWTPIQQADYSDYYVRTSQYFQIELGYSRSFRVKYRSLRA